METIEKIDSILNDLSNENSRRQARKLKKLNKKLSFHQRFINALEVDMDIDPGRLLGLTDGIFGMVMTLLVFSISIPEIQIVDYSSFISFILALLPRIGVTIISFVLISSFWIYHHEFIKLKSLNIPYLWINIFFLISISFIPFTTSLIGNYSHFFLSEVIFGIDILLTNVFFILMYYYADKRNFLEIKPTDVEKKHVLNTLEIILLLTVIVNLLDFNVSSNFIYLFLLVPVVSTIRSILFKMNYRKI